jgi:hypothetical protein
MRRREFIGLLGSVAGALTCADVFAAQKSPMARMGFLFNGPRPPNECCADAECKSPRRDAYQTPKCFEKAWPILADLHALGWRDGENLHVEWRFADGDAASRQRLAAELVALRPDILVAGATIETKAFQAATSDIPIVFMVSTDPVGTGIVDSLSRPGRNATGMSLTPQILWSKRLEIIAFAYSQSRYRSRQ